MLKEGRWSCQVERWRQFVVTLFLITYSQCESLLCLSAKSRHEFVTCPPQKGNYFFILFLLYSNSTSSISSCTSMELSLSFDMRSFLIKCMSIKTNVDTGWNCANMAFPWLDLIHSVWGQLNIQLLCVHSSFFLIWCIKKKKIQLNTGN